MAKETTFFQGKGVTVTSPEQSQWRKGGATMKPLLAILALMATLTSCTPPAEQGKRDAERIAAKCDALVDELRRRAAWMHELDSRDAKGAAKPREGASGVPPKTWKTPDSMLQEFSPAYLNCILAQAGGLPPK